MDFFFINLGFVNNGLDSSLILLDFLDFGLGGFMGKRYDYGKFWVFILCNIMVIVFYMYDGCMGNMLEVLEYYNIGGYYVENFDLNV